MRLSLRGLLPDVLTETDRPFSRSGQLQEVEYAPILLRYSDIRSGCFPLRITELTQILPGMIRLEAQEPGDFQFLTPSLFLLASSGIELQLEGNAQKLWH